MSDYTPACELFDMSGRVAIVTGAPGQLGTAIAETLAELGANVVVVSRTEAECEEVAERLTSEYQRALSAPADITEPGDIETVLELVDDEFGRLDVLVNNAYSGSAGSFDELTADQVRDVFEVALTGMFLVTREALPLLLDGSSSVINVSSIYGLVAPDHSIYGQSELNNPVHYGMAKAGVIQFSRWIATRFGRDDLRANTLTPGGIYNPELEDRRDYNDVFVPNYEERTPLGRMGSPEDVKGAVAFLASDASQWVTGENVIVDGGWTAW